MSNGEDVQQIALQRLEKLGGRMLQSNPVVSASVVHKNVEGSKRDERFGNAMLAIHFPRQIGADEVNCSAIRFKPSRERATRRLVSINDNEAGAFASQKFDCGLANTRCA